MAVILNNKKSTNGGPYGYYTVETTNITNRTQTSVDISFKVTVHLGNSESLSGTGRPLTGGLYLQGNWYTFTIKNSSTSWSGTANHYINVTKTVTGLTSMQTSITGVQFRSVGSSSYGATLSATACSDITDIPSGHQPPELTLTSITETNTALVNAGVPNDTFVANLSKKTFSLSASPYDNAYGKMYGIKISNKKHYYMAQLPYTNSYNMNIDFKTAKFDISSSPIEVYYYVTDTKDAETQIGPYSYTTVPYEKPILSGSTNAKRNGQTSGKVDINVSGTFYNGAIGNTTNSIKVGYKYWQDGGTEPANYTYLTNGVDVTISGNTFSVSSYEIGSSFNYLNSYLVKIIVEDDYYSSEIQKRITKGIPVWTEYSDRVSFEKLEAKDTDINGALDVVGSITLNGSPIGQTTKNILKASLHSNYSITASGNKKLTMADIDFQQGSALSISSGGIKIGAGITKVKVSGSIHFGTGVNAGDSLRATIFKNGTDTTIAIDFARAGTNGTYEVRNIIPVPITVQENDVLYLYENNATGGRGTVVAGETDTYLIVEEI